jgi:hypothetical protein
MRLVRLSAQYRVGSPHVNIRIWKHEYSTATELETEVIFACADAKIGEVPQAAGVKMVACCGEKS